MPRQLTIGEAAKAIGVSADTLRRWAVHLQNDFKARLDWCVTDRPGANHPPVPQVAGELRRTAAPGDEVVLDARGSTDPDGQGLKFEWAFYPEPGSYRGPAPAIRGAASSRASATDGCSRARTAATRGGSCRRGCSPSA